MKSTRPPFRHDITVQTPSGPVQGEWWVTGSGSTARVVVSCPLGSKGANLSGMACQEETLAGWLLAEIARDAGITPVTKPAQ